jgi:hypothetical protein
MDKVYPFIMGFVTLAGYAAFAGALVALYDERRRVRRLRDDLERARDATETEQDMRATLHEKFMTLKHEHAGAAAAQQDAEHTIAALREQLQRAQAVAFLCNGLEKYAALLKGIDPHTAALIRANEYGLRMLYTAEECLRPAAAGAAQVPPDMEVPEARRVETVECP